MRLGRKEKKGEERAFKNQRDEEMCVGEGGSLLEG